MRVEQRETVLDYHERGMNRCDVDAISELMTDDVRWFSVDADFQRHWYRGLREVRSFLGAMFDNTTSFAFHVDCLLSDPDVPDVVAAEWHNKASMKDGTSYENRGCTVFAFQPDTTRILEVRQYFDWGPLMIRTDWRKSVEALG